MKKSLRYIFLLSVLMISFKSDLFCGSVSFDQLSVSGDLSVNKYNGDLNTIFQKVNTNIDTSNILDDTIDEADMSDNINPRIRTYEGASCEKVDDGLLTTTIASLTGEIPAGTAYPRGFRCDKTSATPKTFTASKWTFVDIDQSCNFQYSEVAIAGATPAVATNSIRLSRVSTDATQILAVQDLRTTSCTAGPFSAISDATGEADLKNIFEDGAGGWETGLSVVSKDASTVTIQKGSAYINGEFRSLTSTLDVVGTTAAVGSDSTSGIDTGSLANSTTYYVYGVADEGGVTPLTGVLSTSASAPTGMTNYRRLGEATTDASASFISADASSISYLGKIRQIKKFQTGAVATGTTLIDLDDGLPGITEGDQFMSLTFTPTSATSILKIDVVVIGEHTGGVGWHSCLWKDTTASALACGTNEVGASGVMDDLNFTHYAVPASTSAITYRVRAGGTVGTTLTFTFNGQAGGRIFGGVMSSSITIEEYER